ncbi:MAG: TFIIB-type zinc ribbon-containing protein [Candidatus Bathyarchaeales archaeon]
MGKARATESPHKDISHYVRVEVWLKKSCPNCGSNKAVKVAETGEICCAKCGLVLNVA